MLGSTEKNPIVKKKVDYVYENYYHDNKSLEETESWMQQIVIDGLLKKQNKKDGDIELLIGGDLNNQLLASNFNASMFNIPFLGVFSACASFAEALIISSSMIDKSFINNSIIVSSSHNLVNEKQFRFPIEYGCIKKKVNSFSSSTFIKSHISLKLGVLKYFCSKNSFAFLYALNTFKLSGFVFIFLSSLTYLAISPRIYI
jgi:stage V sporulation protein AD